MARLIGKGRAWHCAAVTALLITALFYGCTGDEANSANKKIDIESRLDEEEGQPSEIWEGLSAETERQIIQDYWDLKVEAAANRGIPHYYGTYNGYVVVVFRWSNAFLCWRTNIGGIWFWELTAPVSCAGNTIDAWKDGRFYDIADLYEEGLLTREDLIQIAARQDELNEMPQHVFFEPSWEWEGLSAETEKQIVRDYYSKMPEPSNDFLGICRYYGTYNGYAIVILAWSSVWSGDSGTEKDWRTVIGGIDFREPYAPNTLFDEKGMIAAWKDGHFYSIADLYKEGMLTLENLKQIAAKEEKLSGMDLYPFLVVEE